MLQAARQIGIGDEYPAKGDGIGVPGRDRGVRASP
jgi:hypothetical protein